MKNEKYLEKYCTGCGLCSSQNDVTFENKNGFMTPKLHSNALNFCEKYCMSSYIPNHKDWSKSIWGNYQSLYYGYSNNYDIRHRASSGGVITSVCLYLISNNIVDGILHTGCDEQYPWRTKTFCSTNAEEVTERSGSRYAQSSPLKDIFGLIKPGKRYAYVGKPCDVYSLKKFCEDHKEFSESIILTISFFCAGVPSETANLKLLTALSCKPEECNALSYRGNGWPGKAEVKTKAGVSNSMDYQSSWGRILGRDIRTICRFCMNGTGECADISCGDAWYLKDNKPSFEENDGRNVVFGRTSKGDSILLAAKEKGFINLISDSKSEKEIRWSQPFQYERKATMFQKVLALKVLFRAVPNDRLKELKTIKSDISFDRKYEIFKGMIGRLVRKNI